jgi:hypothetical protein
MKLGRHEEARVEFEQAAALTHNSRERTLLLDRAAKCLANVTATSAECMNVVTRVRVRALLAWAYHICSRHENASRG